MRKELVKKFTSLDMVPVENPCHVGTPDVNFINGWIELKWLRAWPKNEDTVIHIDHYTTEQKQWHYKRRRRNGNVWLLLQCRREWLLFESTMAAMYIGRTNKEDLTGYARKYWNKGVVDHELEKILMAGCGKLVMPPETFIKYIRTQ